MMVCGAVSIGLVAAFVIFGVSVLVKMRTPVDE